MLGRRFDPAGGPFPSRESVARDLWSRRRILDVLPELAAAFRFERRRRSLEVALATDLLAVLSAENRVDV